MLKIWTLFAPRTVSEHLRQNALRQAMARTLEGETLSAWSSCPGSRQKLQYNAWMSTRPASLQTC